MPDRMSGIETREIFLNIIETFSKRLVDIGIRHRNRERTSELPLLINELHRLLFWGRRMVSLQLPTSNHPTTIRQFDSNQIRFYRHRLFRCCRRNIRRGRARLLNRFGWDAQTGRTAVLACHRGGSWLSPRGGRARDSDVLSRRRLRKPPHPLDEKVKSQNDC
jgi:hypothetical protein